MTGTNEIADVIGEYSIQGFNADIHFISNGHETDCVHIEDTEDTAGVIESLGAYLKLRVTEIVRMTVDKISRKVELTVMF